jgi:hypothetical protein
MPASQRNLDLFTYTDESGQAWNKRGEEDAVRNAVDGSGAPGANPPWGRETARHSTRKIIYQDPTTFRTKTVIMYTAAASAAIVLGTDTLSFPVEGLAAAVVYTAVRRVPERQPGAGAARNLADHA